jgi:hypothetical protein
LKKYSIVATHTTKLQRCTPLCRLFEKSKKMAASYSYISQI